MINLNLIIEFIVFVGIYETGKFLFKVVVRSFKEMVPDVTTEPFKRFDFENKKISPPPPKPPKPPSALIDTLKYEFLKQDQWDALCKKWEQFNFKQDDSISLTDQIKRVEAAKEFWNRIVISYKKSALMEETNAGFSSYDSLINDASFRVKHYEKQIEHLKAFNDMFRKVGNYEKNNT